MLSCVQPLTQFVCLIFSKQFRWFFTAFYGAEITCETVTFGNTSDSVVAEVSIIVLANHSAHAEDIENFVRNITSMDIGNITANNETYIACAVNTTGKTWLAFSTLELR